MVVICPFEIRRTRALPLSATYTTPEASTATPSGRDSWAEVAGPSPVLPLCPPAITVSIPVAVSIERIAEMPL